MKAGDVRRGLEGDHGVYLLLRYEELRDHACVGWWHCLVLLEPTSAHYGRAVEAGDMNLYSQYWLDQRTELFLFREDPEPQPSSRGRFFAPAAVRSGR